MKGGDVRVVEIVECRCLNYTINHTLKVRENFLIPLFKQIRKKCLHTVTKNIDKFEVEIMK